jgi:hypothetical protein
MAVSPTRAAELNFQKAGTAFVQVYAVGEGQLSDLKLLAGGLMDTVKGLQDLSAGLRATYQKLEEIEKLMKSPGGSPFR